MVKQYVGARYVPKFASPVEWAASTSYEALTIVTFNNASYTSKVPVPPTVGNPANNPQYWALTGNYNAQVEQYRQETETVSNNLTTLQGQITTEVTNRENADTALQETLQGQITTEVTNRENADIALQENIHKNTVNQNKKYVLIADSYATETSVGPRNWATVFEECLPPNCTCTIYAHGGYGFISKWGKFSDLISNVDIDYDVTDVVVCGGSNDIQNTYTEIGPAISQFNEIALTKYPNAHIHVGFIGYVKPSHQFSTYGTDWKTAFNGTLRGYQSPQQHSTYLNGVENIMIGFSWLKDQTHPTEAKSIVLGQYIYQAVLTGSVEFSTGTLTMDISSSYTIKGSITGNLINNNVSVNLESFGITGLSINAANKTVNIGTVGETKYLFPCRNHGTLVNALCNYGDSTKEIISLLLNFELTDGTCTISILPFGNNASKTITSLWFYDVNIYSGALMNW